MNELNVLFNNIESDKQVEFLSFLSNQEIDLIPEQLTVQIKNKYYETSLELILNNGNLNDEIRVNSNGLIYVANEISDDEISKLQELNKDFDKLVFVVCFNKINENEFNLIELIEFKDLKNNEFNEKLGKERIREILDCYEWAVQEEEDDDDDEYDDFGDFDNLDLSELLNKLSEMKMKLSTVSDNDKKHELATKFINDIIKR